MRQRAVTSPIDASASGGLLWQATRACLCAIGLVLLLGIGPAAAVKPISVTGEQDRLEITNLGDAYEGRGDNLQVETAPGVDGATGRMGIRASTLGTNPNWLVFALHNPTDKTIELWLTADRYNVIGSGVVWPDLDARRIEAVTHSEGYVPQRIKSDRADIFRLTIERRKTVTYVAELSSERFSRLYLWTPLEYEQRLRDRQLFNGIMLGVTGLLAIFLTAVFAANHKAIFPSAALVSWCVLALLCVDFGFWHKLFQMRPEDNAQYRAATEAAVAASLVMFLAAFLRVGLWHGFARMLFAVWIAAQLAIVATSVLDPRLAATVARLSLALIGGVGALIVLFLAARGLDRALALAPTWILFLVWLFGAAVTLTGRLTGELAISGLVAGLVLIVLLIGFTVTQFAFRSSEPVYGANPSQQQLRLAAIDRAGVAVWEWSARRDEIKIDTEVEATLGLSPGELPTKIAELLAHLHPADKERVQLAFAAVKERGGGNVRLDLRMRHADSSYRWFEFEGASVATTDPRQLRCVGLVRDITDEKRAHERLVHNAVHDSLTGLPNRELFFDRLGIAIGHARDGSGARPTVFFFDIDKFKSVNSSFGLIVGDSILLTVARRLSRNLAPHDTLARIGGDQFAIFTGIGHDTRELAQFAERLRLALRSPIRIAGQEIVLTGSIGIAVYDGQQQDGRDLVREAEVAMYRAKRAGSDRMEIFTPAMRGDKDARIAIESDLRRAIEARQLKILYQPIVALSNEELIGFEALVRWEHPKLGLLSPADFVPIAEETDLIVQLGSYVLGQAVADIARWQKELPRPEQPLFVSVNVSSRQLIKPDLIQEIRHIVGRAVIPNDSLRLEITESLVMENPEQATHVLELLRDAGIQLALDDFGTGYSSLAYLHRFPFDTIKIDKALVQASSEGDSNAVIVRSIVALAHELGKRIVAEGIETQEDAAFLRSIGCHYAQGFHYGEPMPEDDVSRLLRLIRKADRRMRRRGLVRGQDKKKGGEASGAQPATAGATDAGVPPRSGSPPTTPSSAPAVAAQGPSPPPARPAAAPFGNPWPGRSPVTGPAPAAMAAGPPQLPVPAPTQGPTIDRLNFGLSRSHLVEPGASTQPPPPRPMTAPPILPTHMAAAGTSPPPTSLDIGPPPTPMRARVLRRPNLDALPAGVAASLAKLAGKGAAVAGPQPPAAPQEPGGEPPARREPGKTAAE